MKEVKYRFFVKKTLYYIFQSLKINLQLNLGEKVTNDEMFEVLLRLAQEDHSKTLRILKQIKGVDKNA